jgi:RNA polymerase sigma-70 factor (ECF subfamily)
MVATLTRVLGARHLALVEEAVQDALVRALQQWPYRGLPAEPVAWLFRVARNRALDLLRHARVVDDKAEQLLADSLRRTPADEPEARLADELPPLEDDQLGLMFMTCHPVLSREARAALTLKIVGGFGVREIARALLADPRAVAQRLVRAKRTLRERNVVFARPGAADLAERLDSVLDAIYLLFNEGYVATAGDRLIREDVTTEAIRLAALVTRHPATAAPRTWALLALLLLHAARFPSRVGSDGELFLLRDQDRSKWDRALIAAGMRALDRAAQGEQLSPYHLQAEIAACHASAANWRDTDWLRIASCYRELERLTGSPIVTLNRVIAEAQTRSSVQGIAELDRLADDPRLAGYHVLHAVVAGLWYDAGRTDRARVGYERALALAQAAPERQFLAARLAACRHANQRPQTRRR